MRRNGLKGITTVVETRAEEVHCASLLEPGLSATREGHERRDRATVASHANSVGEYVTVCGDLKKELEKLLGSLSLCRFPDVFLDLLKPWVAKVLQTHPLPANNTYSSTASAQHNLAAATASQRAPATRAAPMDVDSPEVQVDQPYQQATAQTTVPDNDDPELTQGEIAALQLLSFPASLHAVPHTKRMQILRRLLRRVKTTNLKVAATNKARLPPAEILNMVQVEEYQLLEGIDEDIKKKLTYTLGIQQIEEEYDMRSEV
jgi:hypothetical protein